MVVLNLASARDELSGRGFDYLSTTRLTIMLNDAKNALEDEYQWPWLETTATGVPPLTIADLKYVLYVVDSARHVELKGVDARDVIDRDADNTTAGLADSWWLDGTSTLRVYPTNATNALSVRYVQFSPELSADSDTPVIPVRYHSVWIDYAVVNAYKDSDNYSAAMALESEIKQARLPQMIDVFQQRNLQNFERTRFSLWGSSDW